MGDLSTRACVRTVASVFSFDIARPLMPERAVALGELIAGDLERIYSL